MEQTATTDKALVDLILAEASENGIDGIDDYVWAGIKAERDRWVKVLDSEIKKHMDLSHVSIDYFHTANKLQGILNNLTIGR